MSPLERIEHGIGTYTKAERAVADFFLEHPADVVGSTITSISDASGLSKTAIMRMCQRIGYSGYAEFRFSMEKYLNEARPRHSRRPQGRDRRIHAAPGRHI